MFILGIDEGSQSSTHIATLLVPHVACKGNINIDVKVSAQDALLTNGCQLSCIHPDCSFHAHVLYFSGHFIR
jgi:hypothetical protein